MMSHDVVWCAVIEHIDLTALFTYHTMSYVTTMTQMQKLNYCINCHTMS